MKGTSFWLVNRAKGDKDSYPGLSISDENEMNMLVQDPCFDLYIRNMYGDNNEPQDWSV